MLPQLEWQKEVNTPDHSQAAGDSHVSAEFQAQKY